MCIIFSCLSAIRVVTILKSAKLTPVRLRRPHSRFPKWTTNMLISATPPQCGVDLIWLRVFLFPRGCMAIATRRGGEPSSWMKTLPKTCSVPKTRPWDQYCLMATWLTGQRQERRRGAKMRSRKPYAHFKLSNIVLFCSVVMHAYLALAYTCAAPYTPSSWAVGRKLGADAVEQRSEELWRLQTGSLWPQTGDDIIGCRVFTSLFRSFNTFTIHAKVLKAYLLGVWPVI